MSCRWWNVLQAVALVAVLAVSAKAADRHVVLITVDGLPAYLFDDPSAPLPNIRGLAADGVVAEGMTVSNPSVTWPNHTSLVTGCRPELHGVLFNGVLERPGPGLPVKVNPRKDKAELVRVPTIYDVLHAKGLTTAAINWPCTRNSGTIADDFPDVPETLEHSTPRLLEGLDQAGILKEADRPGFNKLSGPARDRIWTQAACQVIRERKPHFVLFHLLNVDAIHHKYGPKSSAGYSAVAYADTCVGEVVEALKDARIFEATTIFITADHGFTSIPKTLQPNVTLRKAGLLTVEGTNIVSARAQVIPEGGIGMLYLTVREKADEDRQAALELFRHHEGIEAILEPKDFAKYGLPQPDEYPQMADLILVAKDGYGFSATATGEESVITAEGTPGTHGFLHTLPKMNAIFVASGKGIRRGEKIGVIENIDVAPTVAKLFGVELKDVQGKPIAESLDGK